MEDQEQQKPKRKKHVSTDKSKKAVKVSDDVLDQEPMRSFLQLAQQEFRLYIALENAWPRKKDHKIEKRQVPEEMIQKTMEKHKAYQTKQFRSAFDEHWSNLKTKENMIQRVRAISFTVIQLPLLGNV